MQRRDCFTEIIDSGQRREFQTGAVRDCDENKGRCDLLPLDIVSGLIKFWSLPYELKDIPVLDSIYMFLSQPLKHKIDDDLIFNAIYMFCIERGWLIPDAVLEVSKHFADGCKKYGERNWEKGIPAHCYIDSAIRHYIKWIRTDEDEPHDRAFVWNLLCLLWTLRHKPECNDLWSDDNGHG